MAKTSKFVRVATSGATIDGRTIDANQLIQAAKNYNPNTYAARGNLEHIRGATGQAPFKSYADVTALKAEPVTIDVAGKPEQRTGLFAQIEANDDLIALNQAGQKLYTSIELVPNFAGSNEAYMVGLAFTDSPASLGTERLQFTTNAKALGNLVSAPDEVKLEFEPEPATQTEATSAFAAMKDFFTSLTKPAAPVAVVAPAAPVPATTPDMSAFGAQILDGMTKLSAAVEAGNKAQTDAVAKVAADLAAFKAEVAATPASGFTARPLANGGSGAILAEC